MTVPVELGAIDLSDNDFWTESIEYRHAAFEALRAQPGLPFFASPEFGSAPRGRGYYALTRMDEILFVSRNPATFISGKGNVAMDLPVEFLEQSLITMDDPRHARLRRIVSRGFTTKAIAALTDNVTLMAKDIVDEVVERGECDAVAEISAKLPLRVICTMMGIPDSQQQFVFEQTNAMLGVQDPEYVGEQDDAMLAMNKASQELANLMHELAAHRATNPADDLISKLLNAEINGEALTPSELTHFFILLTGAGTETTRNAITWGIHLLTKFPEQREAWLSDIDGVTPTAVEEIVRWCSPVISQRRTVAEDAEPMEIAGQPLGPGDKVVMFYWAANRDPRYFEKPESFDVRRSPNPQVGYGGPGPHFCLGAHLARLEINVMFRELLTRIPDIHATGEPARLKSPLINGIKRLPVAFTPGAR
ncbi:cytochrome P450 [Micromonospora sp. NPDC049048]|uniref:cytochrome P450 n=1 Tax=Micromonospora sp. NPDC049048 TaxID=3364263 RepID=UPI00371C90BB